MNRNVLWIFLVAATLVRASSLGSFKATCVAGGDGDCSGIFRNGTDSFSFEGPFPWSKDFPAPPNRYAPGFGPPYIEFSIGTNGGSFTFGGHECDYSVILGGFSCYGDVSFGAPLGPPDDTGLSLGDVVSVVGAGTAQGFFCWGSEECNANPGGIQIFDLKDVHATYQFTLTDPGTPTPFSWTGAQFSFGVAPVPEPGTWVFATLGLAGVVAVLHGRRRHCRARS
jgi:hypothetical protein